MYKRKMKPPTPFNREKVSSDFTKMMEEIGKLNSYEQAAAYLFRSTDFLEKVWQDGKKYGEYIASLELRATKSN